jgi:hypothetical protein
MSTLSTNLIRVSAPAEIAQHLRSVRTACADYEITQNLLREVEHGSIQPSSYAIWLGVSRSPVAVREALKQKFSIQIRQFGIKRLSKLFRSMKWNDTWDLLGGTQGLLVLFSDFSVLEIQNVCRTIGASTKGPGLEAKREKVTELLKALLPQIFSDTPHQTPDPRPLFRLYQRLLPGCTPGFVETVLNHKIKGEWIHFRDHVLFRSHPATLRNLSLQVIFKKRTNSRQWLLALTGKHPSATRIYPGISASMQFSLEVLRRLVKEESSTLSDDDFLEGLVEPLAKRATRKKIHWKYTQEIFDLTVCYLNKHLDAAKKLEMYYGRLLHAGAICWSRRSELFKKSFSALLSIWLKHHPGNELEISNLQSIMTGIPRSRRYEFVRFSYRTLTGRDIDNGEDLKGSKGILDPNLLDKLTPEHALVFFTRLRSARGDKDLVARGPAGYSITGITSSPKESTGDPDMIQITLIHRYSDAQKSEHQIENTKQLATKAEQIATKRVEEGKKKAMSSPDQPKRAFYAASVLAFAIASRSLPLYKETLKWARRFVRDPLTATVLYRAYPVEVKSLLCGIPINLTRGVTLSAIRTRVEECNKILLSLFETACSALREPSFNVRSWDGTFLLLKDVVKERMERSSELKTTLDLSADDLYSIVWEDTLALIIQVEEEALKPGYERLDVNGLRGILNYGRQDVQELKDAESSTYRFLDNLAKARDQLWRKFRPTVHSSAAVLSAPFPRGLPIQYLTGPWLIINRALDLHAPYLAGRANAAVYMSPAAALTHVPADDETRASIGQFIDDYWFALRMLVPSSNEEDAKKQVAKAHAHLVGPLSKPRMSYEEAMRYYQIAHKGDFISRFWPGLPDVKAAAGTWFVFFPEVDDANEIEEWNPVPAKRQETKSRRLEPVYIDYSIRRNFWNNSKRDTVLDSLETIQPVIDGQGFAQDLGLLWSNWRGADEGEILAAFLFLDSQNAATSRLLASAFPSPEDVRYPAVYLDEQFLSKVQPSKRRDAIEYLRGYAKILPPILLAQIAKNTLMTLDNLKPGDSSFIDLETDAFLLVDALSRSDRPGLASELVIKTIIQRPGASSWHRRFLCPTYLRRLPASDAQACFQEFAECIIAKLEEQANARTENLGKTNENVKSAKHTPQQPFVKVTTVKFLAQLLHGSEFVSEDFAFSILSKLSEKAAHMDIRRAVVGSLLNMLQTSTANLAEKIFTILESIIPIAGNLDERHSITEPDWKAAEESLKLPKLESIAGDASPMLYALFNFYSQGHTDVEHGEAFMFRIILPTIERLKQETAKWTHLFLLKYGIDLKTQKELSIPAVPKGLDIWTRFLHLKSSYLPFSYLEEYVDYTIFNIAPPASIKALNKKLTEDGVLRSDPSVTHWLSLYGTGTNINPQFPLAALLSQLSSLPEGVGISTKQVQESFLKQFTVLLWNDEPRYSQLNQFILRNLRPTSFDKAWLTGQKPIVEAIVMYIETLRTRDWERDPNRQPSVLPETFYLRLWLLKYPQVHVGESTDLPLSNEQEAACKAFADQLAKTVDQICGKIYHVKFELVKDAVRNYVSGMHRIVAGCYLGDIEKTRLSWLTRPDELRVELAAFLLGGMVIKDEGARKRVDGVLESWRKSENEQVRRLGLVTKCR